MQISNTNFNYLPQIKQHKKFVSFGQVTPEHFFINMQGFQKNKTWGKFVVGLVSKFTPIILDEKTKFVPALKKIGKTYHNFYKKNYSQMSTNNPQSIVSKIFSYISATTFGKRNKRSSIHLMTYIAPNAKYGEYYDIYMKKLENSANPYKRKIKGNIYNHFKNREYEVYQAQNTLNNKNIILTQISKINDKLILIHAPYESKMPMLQEAKKHFEALKQYKNRELSNDEINRIYEHVGSIHWCISQSMPFVRGSATISDVICKSIFEKLNIQVTPWRKGISPDMEAFITPLDKYSKKYKTLFSS